MSQISRRFMKPEVSEKIQTLLVDCIARCRDQQTATAFVDSLFTATEKIVIAKRVAIALMLLKGRDPEDIRDILKVSTQTIWTVMEWLATRGEGLRTLLEDVMKKDQKRVQTHRDALSDTRESALWFGPTNWKAKRAKQWDRVRKTRVPF